MRKTCSNVQQRMSKIPIAPLHSKFGAKYGSHLQLQWEFKLFLARPGEDGEMCLDSLLPTTGETWGDGQCSQLLNLPLSLISLLAERAKLDINISI